MKLAIQSFQGIAPKLNPRYLPEGGAQVARNVEALGQSVKPIRGLSTARTYTGVLGSTPVQSLYRFGQDTKDGSGYWLGAPYAVDTCRSQIAGDEMEWTFYTDYSAANLDGYPKIYSTVTKNDTARHYRLGIPAPWGEKDEEDPTKTQALVPDTTNGGPLIYIEKSTWSQFSTTGLTIWFKDERTSVNPDNTWPDYQYTFPRLVEYRSVSLAGIASASDKLKYIQQQINATAFTHGIEAIVNESAETVTVTSSVEYANYVMYLAWGGYREVESTLSTYDYHEFIPRGTLGNVGWINFRKKYGFQIIIDNYRDPEDGAPPGTGNTNIADLVMSFELAKDGSGGNALTKSDLAGIIKTSQWGGCQGSLEQYPSPGKICAYTLVASDGVFLAYDDNNTDTKAKYEIRFAYKTYVDEDHGVMSAKAATEQDETRVYAWTWICDTSLLAGMDDSALVIESAPSPPSKSIEVSPTGSVVTLTFPDTVSTAGYTDEGGQNPENVVVTGKRIYRTTAGEYLFVAEIGKATTAFIDTVPADALGAPLPSIDWGLAPSEMQGLINLPNGVMAGFVGRDVYFCDPYRPYAWPSAYQQTLDYPVVGFGRMDTTLVALTTGSPYTIQGSSPEFAVVVKSDLEQACVSKRSIVSMGGAVYYASPDGLMALMSGGSKILTEGMFTREQWQALKPTTLHAYGFENKYIAFHDAATVNGETYYGFVLDMSTGQFTQHTISGVTAGCNDLVSDTLYLVKSGTAPTLVTWGEGDYLTARWKSKKFSLPQITGFVCGQVECENYTGLKCAIYRDGVKVPSELTNDALTAGGYRLDARYPFRLVSGQQGRDWEIDLTWTSAIDKAQPAPEVFHAAIAQAMSEVAS